MSLGNRADGDAYAGVGQRSEVPSPGALAGQYESVRSATESLSAPLSAEDHVVQSMPDASPIKWHLAHTSWYFETFVLSELPGYRPFAPAYAVLFNSYYNSVGEQHPRPKRGLLTRPTLAEVREYRRHVDARVADFLSAPGDRFSELAPVLELGIHHEQQHQELILTDLKHAFAQNPLRPAYQQAEPRATTPAPTQDWLAVPEGMRWIGHADKGFCFDNEAPRHRRLVPPFELASRPVTCGEFSNFIEEGGYRRPELWLSDGWTAVQEQGWDAPLYWEQHDGKRRVMKLTGLEPLDPNEPVCHVSYYEADAYARFANARLPGEDEWEVAATQTPVEGNFVETRRFHPTPARAGSGELVQQFGDVWEWTRSAYSPYPGYRPAAGALGEYNGKFMCNQLVLRGGSCATPISHIRPTYRNFFYPDARWQFSGFRLARDV
jgi:ergothioneine biosynthesis protein EgtB